MFIRVPSWLTVAEETLAMRITGGQAARRQMKVPKGLDVRPTPDRVKQAVFNSLGDRVADARVLELFAGSGALSLECLSRGARLAVCVEKSARHAEFIRRNAAMGEPGFWRMADWIVEHEDDMSRETLAGAAAGVGLDASALLETMDSPDVAAGITSQEQAAKQLGLRFVPMLWIDGRLAERWRVAGSDDDVLTRLLEEAARE